jgi:hypothetical protein
MILNKAGLRTLAASLVGGFCLAYSTACHWFGFLSASKFNRLEMLFVFGVISFFLSWQVLKIGRGIFLKSISWARFYLFLGAALVIAGAVALVFLSSTQDRLIDSQIKMGGSLTTILRLLWVGLKLSDFVSMAGLLLIGEIIFSNLVSGWRLILPIITRGLAVFFPFGLLLFVGVCTNLVISATGNLGTLNKLSPLSGNGLIALDEGSTTYLENIRVYTILFEHYQGWVLIAPADLLNMLNLDADGKLKTWGRISSIVAVDYPAALSGQEMNDLLALKNENVENGTGLHYIAILEGDANRKICLRTYKENVFVVPVSLSPICESR